MSFLCLCKYWSHQSTKQNYLRFWQELRQIWVNFTHCAIRHSWLQVFCYCFTIKIAMYYKTYWSSFSPKKLKVSCLKHIHSVGSTSPAYTSFWFWDNENIHSCKTEKYPRIRQTDSQQFQKSKTKEQSQPYAELIKACLCSFFLSRVPCFKRT